MKKLTVSITCIIMLLYALSNAVLAQNLKKEHILKINGKGIGEILEADGQVKGYYFFYRIESKSKDANDYILEITDENLRVINSVDITKPRSVSLVEAEFNGNFFAFLFYNPKQNQSELLSYDKSLKLAGSIVKPIRGAEDYIYRSVVADVATGFSFLTSTSDGFLFYGYAAGKKWKYSIEQFDNNLKLVWSANSSAEASSKAVETASPAFQSEEYIGSLLNIRSSLFDKDADYHLVVHDKNGKELFSKEVKDSLYNISIATADYRKETNQIVLFGEYYNLKEEEMKAVSLGYFYRVLDMSGKIIETKWLSWEKEMSKVLPVDKTGKMNKSGRVFVHEIIRTANGNFFVVGEQYKKAASGWGIAAAALGGGRSNTSTVQLEIMNMVILEFNSKLEIKSAQIIEKDPHFHLLPAGSEYMATKLLGIIAKSSGWFDFSFSQMSKDKNVFSIAYVNYAEVKGSKPTDVLGIVTYTPEKTFVIDKTSLNRKSTYCFVRRGKPGYVFVAEYFKKEKSVDYRLEKINY